MSINLSRQINDEERMLLHRMQELFSRADNGSIACSQFLNLRERYIIENMLPRIFNNDEAEPLCFFWGGFDDAERTLLCCLPAYYRYSLTDGVSPGQAFKDELSSCITTLRVNSSGYVKLSHRDYLGSLIGLGIDRSALGDILLDDEGAIIFAAPSVAELLKNELIHIGRDKVRAASFTLPDGFSYVRRFEEIRGTVASPRLDAVLSEIARTSRESAKQLVAQGFVEHNHFTASRPDCEVLSGDIISVRKVQGCKGGKFIIDTLDERSSKGRIRLAARRYL